MFPTNEHLSDTPCLHEVSIAYNSTSTSIHTSFICFPLRSHTSKRIVRAPSEVLHIPALVQECHQLVELLLALVREVLQRRRRRRRGRGRAVPLVLRGPPVERAQGLWTGHDRPRAIRAL